MILKELEAWARGEMRRYPECAGWLFRWSRSHKDLGDTNYERRTVRISGPYALRAPFAEVQDTLLHEISHVIAGEGTGHGPLWIAACAVTGAEPVVAKCAVNGLGPYFVGSCECFTGFGPVIRRRSTPPSPHSYCKKCSHKIDWT